MAEWTTALVENVLREAAAAGQLIDDGVHVEADAVRALTGAATWLAVLGYPDGELVRLRSSGARWKPICWQLGIGRATAHRRWKAGLRTICDRLNEGCKLRTERSAPATS